MSWTPDSPPLLTGLDYPDDLRREVTAIRVATIVHDHDRAWLEAQIAQLEDTPLIYDQMREEGW